MARVVLLYHWNGWLTHRFLRKFKGGIKLHTKSRKARLFATQDNFDNRKRISTLISLILWIVYDQESHFIPLEWEIHASFSLEIQRRHKTSHRIAESSLICNTGQLWQQKRGSAMISRILWIVHGPGNTFIPLEGMIDASFSQEIQRRHKTSHKIAESSLICNTGQLWQQKTGLSHDRSDSLDSAWPG